MILEIFELEYINLRQEIDDGLNMIFKRPKYFADTLVLFLQFEDGCLPECFLLEIFQPL